VIGSTNHAKWTRYIQMHLVAAADGAVDGSQGLFFDRQGSHELPISQAAEKGGPSPFLVTKEHDHWL
jgi:hypothetical protein